MFNAILIFISSSETIQHELFYAVVVTLNVCCCPTQVVHIYKPELTRQSCVTCHPQQCTLPNNQKHFNFN
jgi:hypothetical protein